MNLKLETSSTSKYKSKSQIARVMTETWLANNMYCPRCGHSYISLFKNNMPVADFYCPDCLAEFELKSKDGTIENKILDGAYETMIQRILSDNNPDFFFLNYSYSELLIKDFVIIPKHFFVPAIIEKRNPLSATARRAGWVGCNILLNKIPQQGRISVVSNGIYQEPRLVLEKMNNSERFKVKNIESRGWLFDVLHCVNQIIAKEFSLAEVYKYEDFLSRKHPNNHNIKAKIRQQLQFLRDRGVIEFLGNGKNRKL